MHDDSLLLHESLVLESFPSPYSVKCITKAPLPPEAPALHVVASVILDKLMGLDVTKKVTVPRTAVLGATAANAGQHGMDHATQQPQELTPVFEQPQHLHHLPHQQVPQQQQHWQSSQLQQQRQSQQRQSLLQDSAAPADAHVIDLTRNAEHASLQPDKQAIHDHTTASRPGGNFVISQSNSDAGGGSIRQHPAPTLVTHDRHGPLRDTDMPGIQHAALSGPSMPSNLTDVGPYSQTSRQFVAPTSISTDLPQMAPASALPLSQRLSQQQQQQYQQQQQHQQHTLLEGSASQPVYRQQNRPSAFGSMELTPSGSFGLSTASARLPGPDATNQEHSGYRHNVNDADPSSASLHSARESALPCLKHALCS